MKKFTIFLTAVLCTVLCFCSLAFTACTDDDKVQDAGPFLADEATYQNRVFYEIFVGSFSDSDGDGTGDLRGIINRFDYLNDGNVNSCKSLGVQGIWLTPIFKSVSYHKYDVWDYYEIDPDFGTMDDLKELIELCHKRNVKLILDLVLNHSSNLNANFREFEKAHKNGDIHNQYYDYYSYASSNSEMKAGNRYKLISGTGHSYECNFSDDMPEMNYDNMLVREDAVKIAKHYLDMGIDGFRFDAIKYVYYGETERNVEFWNWYMGELRAIKPDIYTVGECWSGDAEIKQYYTGINCFAFSTHGSSGTVVAATRNGAIDSFTKHVEQFNNDISGKNPNAMFIPFLANHDTDRAAGFMPVDEHKMHMAANLYLLCGGSPFIYYGEEIGMKGSRGSAQTDANRRLAMLWGDEDTVKNPSGTTFSADKQINGTVASQTESRSSLLNYYRDVIRMRKKFPQLAEGKFKQVKLVSFCGGFEIEYKDEKSLLIHNVSGENMEVDISSAGSYGEILTYIGQGDAKLSGTKLSIGPLTSVLIK